ncbi:MAG TPA: hypothetical protein PK819_03500 [Thermomicrobiales bacterium]|nr:hypothetical protein [Thermomicrobiales bacterium]
MSVDRSQINAEMQRTAFQKKAVVKLTPIETLAFCKAYLNERGYKAGPAARPGQIFVLGKSEGIIPRVTGEIAARANVGKAGTTLVTVDGFGELLGPALRELLVALRAESKAKVAAASARES